MCSRVCGLQGFNFQAQRPQFQIDQRYPKYLVTCSGDMYPKKIVTTLLI